MRSSNEMLEHNMRIFYRLMGTISLLISGALFYAIVFHSERTKRRYLYFVVAAQVLNVLHDLVYNFSFAPMLDETHFVLYSAGGLLTSMNVPVGWQLVIALSIRLECACCTFGALFYRHQLVQSPDSKQRLSTWQCILVGVIYNAFILTILVPLSVVAVEQRNVRDIIERDMLPSGAWLLRLHSTWIVPDFSNEAFTIFALGSLVASFISVVLFTVTSKLIINTLKDSRSIMSSSTKRQHARAISALRAQSVVPLIVVTLPFNLMMLSASIIPPMHWLFYTILLGMPATQSILASLITIYFPSSYRRFFHRQWLRLSLCCGVPNSGRSSTVPITYTAHDVNNKSVILHLY